MFSVSTLLVATCVAFASGSAIPQAGQYRKDLHILDHLAKEFKQATGFKADNLRSYMDYLSKFTAVENFEESDSEDDRIIKKIFSAATPVENPHITFLGGGTASGKSSIKPFLLEKGLIPDNHINLDPDEIMFEFADYRKELNHSHCAANLFHERASTLSKKIFALAVSGKYNILKDGTLANAKSLADFTKVKENGYEVNMAGVFCDSATAAIRSMSRAKNTHRYVGLSVIASTHAGYAENFLEFAGEVKKSYLFESRNDVPPELILSSEAHSAEMIKFHLLHTFLEKNKLTTENLNMQLPKEVQEEYSQLNKDCGA
eukprot:Awhi_evm1s14981